MANTGQLFKNQYSKMAQKTIKITLSYRIFLKQSQCKGVAPSMLQPKVDLKSQVSPFKQNF